MFKARRNRGETLRAVTGDKLDGGSRRCNRQQRHHPPSLILEANAYLGMAMTGPMHAMATTGAKTAQERWQRRPRGRRGRGGDEDDRWGQRTDQGGGWRLLRKQALPTSLCWLGIFKDKATTLRCFRRCASKQ
ncbi:hypothetical protein E2562_029369 [Oryza meyeriana var. granulata]|uniref:Uncharacterized protein n=1 Tax=Oryza meyeriana var. granulata TaxID=110450 RepID=A0A6G1CAN7_9ORYZ|nr:hypothetical protein E2562_029369 [Oryza meyeriana var. granulata]